MASFGSFCMHSCFSEDYKNQYENRTSLDLNAHVLGESSINGWECHSRTSNQQHYYQTGSDLCATLWKEEYLSKGREKLPVRGIAMTKRQRCGQDMCSRKSNFDIKISCIFLLNFWLLLWSGWIVKQTTIERLFANMKSIQSGDRIALWKVGDTKLSKSTVLLSAQSSTCVLETQPRVCMSSSLHFENIIRTSAALLFQVKLDWVAAKMLIN